MVWLDAEGEARLLFCPHNISSGARSCCEISRTQNLARNLVEGAWHCMKNHGIAALLELFIATRFAIRANNAKQFAIHGFAMQFMHGSHDFLARSTSIMAFRITDNGCRVGMLRSWRVVNFLRGACTPLSR